MTLKIKPPSLTAKPYELYILELLAWREVTEISQEKQGIVIALSLPENDRYRIREKVFSEIKLDNLKRKDGLDILIKFLDKHLKKDELTDIIEKFEAFENFQRAEGQSITEFIASFDFYYRKIEKLNMKLPSEILAFKLIQKANVSNEEKLLVLTGMNYRNKGALYEEAIASLKKFKGDMNERSSCFKPRVQAEPAISEKCENVLLVAGVVEKSKDEMMVVKPGRSRSGGHKAVGQYGHIDDVANKRKRRNPLGANGRLLLCKSCGSYRHLIAKCPDSWENMDKLKANKIRNEYDYIEDPMVFFTKHETDDNMQQGVNDSNFAVLDSACSITVCGENWLNDYLQSLSRCDRRKVQQKGSRTAFKFGGGRMLKSEGEYWLPVVIAGKEVTVRTEVVKSDIPLLLSREAMKKAGVKIDLGKDTVTIFGEDQVLKITSSGHCCVPIGRGVPIAREEVVSDKLYKTNKNDTVDCLEKKWFHMRSTQFEDSNEHLQEVTDRNVVTRETQEILGKAVNDNATANFLIMSCPRKATEKDSKRQIHMTQHQLRQESRWDAENNQSSREEDKKEGHSIQEGKTWKEGTGLIRGQQIRWRMNKRRGKFEKGSRVCYKD